MNGMRQKIFPSPCCQRLADEIENPTGEEAEAHQDVLASEVVAWIIRGREPMRRRRCWLGWGWGWVASGICGGEISLQDEQKTPITTIKKKENMASWSHFHNLFAVFVQLSRTHSRNTSSMALQTKRKKDTLPFFFQVLKWNPLATSILPSNTPRFNNYQILVGKLLRLIWQVIQHPADASSLGHILRWLPK